MKALFFCVFSLFSFFSWAQSYDDIKLVPSNPSISGEIAQVLKQHGFWSLKSNEEFSTIGINQIFFDEALKGFITVKHHVSGDISADKVMDAGPGKLLHIKLNDKFIAFYFKGVDASKLEKVTNDLSNLNFQLKTTSIIQNLAPVQLAKADCYLEPHPEVTQSSAFSTMSEISSSNSSSMLWGCLKGSDAGIKEELYGSTLETAKLISNEAKEFWNNPTTKINQYYKAVDSAVTGFQSLIYIIGECMSNPSHGARLLKNKLGDAGEAFSQIISTFSELPPPVAAEMICSFISGIGVNVVLGAFTGGAALVNLAKSLNKTINVLDSLQDLFAMAKKMNLSNLSKLGLDSTTQNKLFAKIREGNIDVRKVKIFNDSLLEESKIIKNLALTGLQCSL